MTLVLQGELKQWQLLESPMRGGLAEKIEVKYGLVKVLHTTLISDEYRARGFESPMEIPLELILNEGTAIGAAGTTGDVANLTSNNQGYGSFAVACAVVVFRT